MLKTNHVRYLAAIFALLLLSAGFSAASGGSPDYIGMWYLTDIEADSVAVNQAEPGAVSMRLYADYTADLRNAVLGDTTGVWRITEDGIDVIDDTQGQTVSFIFTDGLLMMELEDVRMTFRRECPQTADPAVLLRGIELAAERNFDEMLAHFDRALADNTNTAAYHAGRAEALYGLNRYDEAEAAYLAALALTPDNAQDWCRYGLVLLDNQKKAEAIEAMGRAIALDDAEPTFFLERGIALFLSDKHEDALTDFEQVMRLNADDVNAYYFAAMIRYSAGDYEEAARCCEVFINKVPDDYLTWLVLGNARFLLGDYEEAMVWFDKLIQIGGYTADDLPYYREAYEQLSRDE